MTPVVRVDRDQNSGGGMDHANTYINETQAYREEQFWARVSENNILRHFTTQGKMENVLYLSV